MDKFFLLELYGTILRVQVITIVALEEELQQR